MGCPRCRSEEVNQEPNRLGHSFVAWNECTCCECGHMWDETLDGDEIYNPLLGGKYRLLTGKPRRKFDAMRIIKRVMGEAGGSS